MTKRKPLYWRIGKGPWHEDPLCSCGFESEPLTAHYYKRVLKGDSELVSGCDWVQSRIYGHDITDDDIETRRSAPPVADQCKRCRAAKERARKGGE